MVFFVEPGYGFIFLEDGIRIQAIYARIRSLNRSVFFIVQLRHVQQQQHHRMPTEYTTRNENFAGD